MSMVISRRSLAGLCSTRWIKVACRAVLMLSLMAMVLVERGEPSLLMMSLRSRRVRPFLVEGTLGVAGGGAAAGAGLADGGEAFFFVFLKIGRASCRERVEIWVVGVAFMKKSM